MNRKSPKLPLHAGPIEDYAVIGDCETAALVRRDGSIDWICWPNFSSAACFASLLGTADHGFWRIAAAHPKAQASRRYLPDSLVLETTFRTPDGGAAQVLDFMPPRVRDADAAAAAPTPGASTSSLVRIVRGLTGSVPMHMDLTLRFDFGRTIPWVVRLDEEGVFGLRAVAGGDMLTLRADTAIKGKDMSTISDFTVRAGEVKTFTLSYSSAIGPDGNHAAPSAPTFSPLAALTETIRFWGEWNSRCTYQGEFGDAVGRSLMTLKAMTYRPSGGIVAAVTASLPEQLGGKRNWDYRYCWLRDTAFTLLVLLNAGYDEEAAAWRRWLLRAIAGAPDQVQTIYGIRGERQLTEYTADWLPGYENSRPVNLGNAASTQFQLDVFGEVAAALSRTPDATTDIRVSASALQANLIDHLCQVWDQPDDGIWETRGDRKHFTHSKVMAWSALDLAIRHYEQYDGGGDVKRWIKNRDLLHREICKKGFNKRLNSFTQSYGSKELDASCLRIGLVGFLPMDDPRIVGTVDAIEAKLMRDGLLLRYDTRKSPDGLPPGEGKFLACSFWLATNFWLIGRRAEARTLYERLLALRNDVGLLAEEWDSRAKRQVGNFPQALSHIALAHTAFTFAGKWKPELGTQPR